MRPAVPERAPRQRAAAPTAVPGADRIRVVAAPLRMQVVGLLRESILSSQYTP